MSVLTKFVIKFFLNLARISVFLKNIFEDEKACDAIE